MSNAERFAAYAAAFEETYADDDWSRLRQYFTDDAVYETVGDDGTHTTFEGLERVLDGLRNAVNTFDRRFKTRKVDLLGELEERDGSVYLDWAGTYTTRDAPPLRMSGAEQAVYEGDRIRHLKDTFDAGTTEALGAWMTAHGDKLSPPKD